MAKVERVGEKELNKVLYAGRVGHSTPGGVGRYNSCRGGWETVWGKKMGGGGGGGGGGKTEEVSF